MENIRAKCDQITVQKLRKRSRVDLAENAEWNSDEKIRKFYAVTETSSLSASPPRDFQS